jgi:hypothetical protein
MAKHSTAFPVGLYGALLLALCALTIPAPFAPVERALLGGAALVGRFVAGLVGTPVAANTTPAAAAAQRVAALHARLDRHGAAGAPAGLVARFDPAPCTVVVVGGRGGGGGEPCELRLDRTYAELADCLPIVTQGDRYLGHVPQPGGPGAQDDALGDFARVLLANHPLARSVHADVEVDAAARLRVVVGPASAADPAPLRVDLWDDPYQAARLDRAFLPVRTRDVPGSASAAPGGFRVGTTRIWGYPRTERSESLTLGVYVTPDALPQALSHVVVWRQRGAEASGPERRRAPTTRPGVAHALPGAAHGRCLLVADENLADGAAVLQDGRLLGVAKGLAGGAALLTGFGASRQPWNLILLPDDPAAAPVELHGAVVHSTGERVWVRCRARATTQATIGPGQLFTGSNGPACPPGLWIGAAAADPGDFDQIVVESPAPAGACAVHWCEAEGLP